ncbi:MAG: FAD-binding oxidoreductase [Acidobacteriota bacterium]|nr:MAG: FAD-binding oxidoreductase [Acidobacteriota bacterium]
MSDRKRHLLNLACLGVLVGVFAVHYEADAHEDGQEGHAEHHGGEADSAELNGQASSEKGGGGMGGQGMGGKGMGGKGPGNTQDDELYPHLMSLPEMTPEARAGLEAQAHQRMIDGAALMSEGLDELAPATATDDYASMQRATSRVREGVSQFETGLATHRAIVEGTSPRNEALQWLKQELSLARPATEEPGLQLLGMGTFHTFVMLVLVASAVAMLGMYYFKMQRASTLLHALATGDMAGNGQAAGPATALAPAPTAGKSNIGETIESDSCPAGTLLASDQPAEGLLPLIRRKLCNLRVAQIIQETPDVKTFRMVSCHDGPIPFSYLPGQFLTLTLPVGDKPIRRSYTISSSPTQGYYCEITVKREDKGQGSRYLHDIVKEGDELEAQAASGRLTFTGKEAESVVLIGGGVGITPMISITRALTDMGWGGQIYFIVAARDPESFIFRSELKRLEQRHANLHVFAALSRLKEPVDGYSSGRLTKDLLAEWVPEIAAKRIYICGAPPMMDSTKQMLAELGVPKESVQLENFGSGQKPKAKQLQREQAGPEATQATSAAVTFTTSGKSTALLPDETVLEASERVDVDIDYSCRVGTCGVCRTKKLSGEVTQEVTDGLEPGDEEAGMILACQAKSTDNVAVEA